VYARLVATVRERYGASNYFSSEKYKQDNIAKYGVPHPMMNKDYALGVLERMKRAGPNFPERMLHSLVPELLYTGNGAFWRWLPKLGHHKNPDFILPGPDLDEPRRGVTKVVEMFGDFWHSRMFTGKANFEHEQELVEAFRDIGIECLVIWESEIKKDSPAVQAKIKAFLVEGR
jgi:hypothetical protein